MEEFHRIIHRPEAEKRKPCLICCQFFARDRDLILVETDIGFYYICESYFGQFLGGDKWCNSAFSV